MGGIAGIHSLSTALDSDELAALGDGIASRQGDTAILARPRSTLARNARFTVAVAGHFDRAPASGQSAAETLLEHWARSGIDALGQFEGAWVAAIHDHDRRALHLLRDPFGIRRIYFVRKGTRLAFSSRIATLLDLPWVSRELARENLSEYLAFRYVHAPRTLLHDVQALPAGHHLRFAGDVRIEPWFKLRYAPPYAPLPDDPSTLEELERRLNRAVAARASGKERVGVFLSGGLDSTALTLFASRLGPVHTFTVGATDSDGDETPYAGRVASLLRSHHEVLRVDFTPFADSLDTVIAGSDQPLTDPAAIPQYLLARAARPHVDVILAGDGGDEIFGGRMVAAMATEFRVSGTLARLPGGLRDLAAGAFSGSRPELRDPGVPFGLARLIGGAHIFSRDARAGLLRDPGWVRPGIRRACLEPLYREVTSDPINEILYAYLRGRMAEDALPRSGAATGLVGLALREPLLDRDLVSWCARLPGHWKVRRTPLQGVMSKWPLRELLRPVLGRALVQRPKRVLPGPWRAWLGGAGGDFQRERVARLKEDRLNLFLPGAIDGLVQRLDQPGADAQLWALFFLDGWARNLGLIRA